MTFADYVVIERFMFVVFFIYEVSSFSEQNYFICFGASLKTKPFSFFFKGLRSSAYLYGVFVLACKETDVSIGKEVFVHSDMQSRLFQMVLQICTQFLEIIFF